MTEAAVPDEKPMRLRYAGACRVCASEIAQGVQAVYERSTRTVRCVTCPTDGSQPFELAVDTIESVEVAPGTPGGSARREFERRRARREDRVRSKHQRLGGLILAVTDDPQSTRAWNTGAVGEERLGARLNELAGDSIRVLHDRRVPQSSANIDHVVISTHGVHVVDAKRYAGRPRLVVEGGLLRPRVERLVVGTRDRSKVVDGVLKQVEVVRGLLGSDIPVRGVLCFVEAEWPLIGGAFTTRGVDVLWPKRLDARLREPGPLPPGVVATTHAVLARDLRPA